MGERGQGGRDQAAVTAKLSLPVAVALLALTHASLTVGGALTESTFPTRPVRIVVPYPPGASPNDVTARILQPKLAEQLRQQVVIDNRPGAASTIGTDLVVKSSPDGYTLLLNSTSLTIVPSAYRNLPFDPYKDLAPITMLSAAPQLVMVNAAVPAATLKELIAYVKARPGQFKFSSGGNGTLPHLAGELINHMAGLQMLHIPYKGGAPAASAMISGEVQMFIGTSTGALGNIKAGKVKVLGVAAKQRTPILPDVPTMEEAGLPGYEVRVWYGIWAPAKTPRPIVQALFRHFRATLDSPEVRARFAAADTQIVGSTPEEFTRAFHSELRRWAKFVSETGLKLD
ncbi:MAG: tripartite tricarboxylate transporter substrate binding protein [Burkholderiales bacterium]